MSFTEIQVVPGPANYYCFPGAIRELTNFYSESDLQQAMWVYGERALEAAQAYLPAVFHAESAGKGCIREHCNEPMIARFAEQAGPQCKVIIGLGGGTVMDSAKALAARMQLPVVLIPTIAATCAAWTPLSVWYNPEGENIGYEIFKQANHLVLVEPEIILQAPAPYLLAGIADTLAKWYEASVLVGNPDSPVVPYLARTALNIARGLKDLLLSDSADVLAEQRQGVLTAKFIAVVDAIIAGGGLIGGLGERFTRVAAAHSVHNGMTVLPQTHEILHGIKVAYGILVQVALQKDQAEFELLLRFYRELQLPTSLRDLNIDIANRGQIDAMIAHTLRAKETIHLMPMEITPDVLFRAMETIEQAAGHQA